MRDPKKRRLAYKKFRIRDLNIIPEELSNENSETTVEEYILYLILNKKINLWVDDEMIDTTPHKGMRIMSYSVIADLKEVQAAITEGIKVFKKRGRNANRTLSDDLESIVFPFKFQGKESMFYLEFMKERELKICYLHNRS